MENQIIRNQQDFAKWLDGRKGKPLYAKDGDKISVDHVATANVLCRFIQLMPMDSWCKRVMIMRIGYPLKQWKSLSYMQIALSLGCTEDEVREVEKEGISKLSEYLSKVTTEEFVNKAMSERSLAQKIEEIQKQSDANRQN